MDKAFGREAGKLTSQKARNLGLINVQDVGGASLGESPRANGLGNADRKVGFGKTVFGVGQTNVCENIAAAFLDLHFFPHAHYSL